MATELELIGTGLSMDEPSAAQRTKLYDMTVGELVSICIRLKENGNTSRDLDDVKLSLLLPPMAARDIEIGRGMQSGDAASHEAFLETLRSKPWLPRLENAA